MLFDSIEFRAMQSGIDSLAMRQKLILQNLANYDTPGYKAKDLVFKDMLGAERARREGRVEFQATVMEDETSMRPDGNSVDADLESMKLTQNYIQQMALYQKIGGQFTNMRYVFNQFTK